MLRLREVPCDIRATFTSPSMSLPAPQQLRAAGSPWELQLSQGLGWQDTVAVSPPRTAHSAVPCRGIGTALRFLTQHLLLSYLHIKGVPNPHSGIHLGNNTFPGVVKERLLGFQYQYFIKLCTPRGGVFSPVQSVDTFV